MTQLDKSRLGHALDNTARLYIHSATHLAARINRKPWLSWTVVVALTLACAFYINTHFSIDTNMTDLVAKHLPYRQLDARYHQIFPDIHETIVVLIRSPSSMMVDKTRSRLVRWIKAHPHRYQDLYEPGGGRFFERNGLLYLSTGKLKRLLNQLVTAEPLIGHLSQNPTLPGLFSLLHLALTHREQIKQSQPEWSPILADLATATQDSSRGLVHPVPWAALMTGSHEAHAQHQALVIVHPTPTPGALRPFQSQIARLRTEIAHLQSKAEGSVKIGLTGAAVLDNEQLKTATSGIGISVAISLIAVLAILILGLRRIGLIVSVFLTLLLSLLWSTAAGLWLMGSFNLISLSFAVLFIGLGVDFSIQFCIRYLDECRTQSDISSALERTSLFITGPLSLAALAAAISFFSFAPTNYAGIIALGIISGTSMFISLAATLLVLPLLIRTFTRYPRAASLHPYFELKAFRFNKKGLWISVAAATLGIVSVFFILRMQFDFNPLNLENPHSEAVRTFRTLVAHSKFSPYSIDLVEPNLRTAQEVAQRLDHVQSVRAVITLASFVPKHQQAKLAIIQQSAFLLPPFLFSSAPTTGHPGASVLPPHIGTLLKALHSTALATRNTEFRTALLELEAALSQFQVHAEADPRLWRLLEQNLMGSLTFDLARLASGLNPECITLSNLPPSLRSRYISPRGLARAEVFSRWNINKLSRMRRFVNQVRSVEPRAVGAPVMLLEGGDAVLHAFQQATVTAFILILLLLLLVLRDLRDTLLAVIPLVLATLLASATMELAGISYNLANIIVLPLLMGLSVAYGIYFILRWREGLGLDRVLTTSTTYGILISGLASLSTFGSLALSAAPGVSMLGKTLLIVLSWVLICTLVALPAILSQMSSHNRTRE